MRTYQFEKIHAEMERECGKKRKGEEYGYTMLLFPMEGNVLKVHRAHPGVQQPQAEGGDRACAV